MPRFLHVVALVMAFAISGAPAWLCELAQDDCAESCAEESGCPDEGCADCSIVCSSCPRGPYVPPQLAVFAPTTIGVSMIAHAAGEPLPVGPPAEGVFHPPRRAG